MKINHSLVVIFLIIQLFSIHKAFAAVDADSSEEPGDNNFSQATDIYYAKHNDFQITEDHHTIHEIADKDWYKFYVWGEHAFEQGFGINTSNSTGAVLTLKAYNENLNLVAETTDFMDLALFIGQADSGFYYLEISADKATPYTIQIGPGTGQGAGWGRLFIAVLDQNDKPISDAQFTDTIDANTLPVPLQNGQFVYLLQAGAHTFNISASGFETKTLTQNVTAVDNLEIQELIVTLNAINQPPIAKFSATPKSGVAPLTVSLDGSLSTDEDGSIQSYAWSTSNGLSASGQTTSFTFNETGNYTITLTVTDNQGASSQTSTNISVNANQAPTAKITASATSAIAPSTISFEGGQSSDSDGSIASYQWSVSNGLSANTTNADFTFDQAGDYTVTLTVTDNNGASDQTSELINIVANKLPTAKIVASTTSGIAPLKVKLDGGQSNDSDGFITAYQWSASNGLSASDTNPTFIFDQPGNYTVTLTVTDDKGGSSQTSETIIVEAENNPPTAKIVASATSGIAPLTVSFDGGQSSDSDGSIATYQWSASNGLSANTANTEFSFEQAGTYTVTLMVTDDKGATATASETITVAENQAPSAKIVASANSGVAPITITLEGNQSSDPDGSITAYQWSTSNGLNANTTNAEFSFEQTGTYTVTLTVTDNKGATATASETITVAENQAPTAKIIASANTGPAPLTITLDGGQSNDPDGSIASYQWDASNGLSATTANAEFTFDQTGDFTVTLTVTDDKGATASASETITVGSDNIAPIAKILASSTTGVAPFTITLDGGQSTDSDGTISTYQWSASNGLNADTASVDFTFQQAGDFTVTLTVTDDKGASSSTNETISVADNQPPTAKIVASDISGVAPLTVSLDGDESNDADGSISAYQWNGPNGFTADSASAELTFEQSGEFTVTLTVTDDKGATASTEQTIIVAENQPPVAKIIASATAGVAPLSVNLDGGESSDNDGEIANYQWSSSNGFSADTAATELTFNQPGEYTLSLTVTDDKGMTATASETFKVRDSNVENITPIAKINASDTFGAAPFTLSVDAHRSSDEDGNIENYFWNSSDGENTLDTSSAIETEFHFDQPGEYIINLTVVDDIGASSSDTLAIKVIDPNNDEELIPLADALDLTENQVFDDLNNTVEIVGADNQILLSSDDETHILLAETVNIRFSLRAIDLLQLSSPFQAGIAFNSDGLLELISQNGHRVILTAEPQQIDALTDILALLDLQLQQYQYGMLKIGLKNDPDSVWFAARVSYESLLLNPEPDTLGIITLQLNGVNNTIAYAHHYAIHRIIDNFFEVETIFEQVINPTAAHWISLKNFLSTDDFTATISPYGLVTFKQNEVIQRGIIDYVVIKSDETAEEVRLQSISDRNQDGLEDYLIIYKNGEKQIMYRLP